MKPLITPLLCLASVLPLLTVWADTDHGGQDVTFSGEVYGRQYNIGTATIAPGGVTIRRPVGGDENQGGKLMIEARVIIVNGPIYGDGHGFAGGGGGGGGGGGDQDNIGLAGAGGAGTDGSGSGATGAAGSKGTYVWSGSTRYGIGGDGGIGGHGHGYPGIAGPPGGGGNGGNSGAAVGIDGYAGTDAISGAGQRIGCGGGGGGGGGGAGSPTSYGGGGGGGGCTGGAGGAMVQLKATYRLTINAAIYTMGRKGSPGVGGASGTSTRGGNGGAGAVATSGFGFGSDTRALGGEQVGTTTSTPTAAFAPAGGQGGLGGAGSGGSLYLSGPIVQVYAGFNTLGGRDAANAGPVEIYAGPSGYSSTAASQYNPAWFTLGAYQPTPTLPAPTITLPAGSPYAPGMVSVTLSANDAANIPGQVIRYTTDGSTPTESSAVYTGPFNVGGSNVAAGSVVVVKAVSFVSSGYAFSAVASRSVTYQNALLPPALTAADPDLGSFYSNSVTVTLGNPNTDAPSAELRYALDSAPGPTSPLYTGPITLTQGHTLRAYLRTANRFDSPVVTREFAFKAKPVAFDKPNDYQGAAGYLLTASSASPGCAIYYTETHSPGGSPEAAPTGSVATPVLSPPPNTSQGTLQIYAQQTLRAVAWRSGWYPSDEAVGSFGTNNQGEVSFNPPPFPSTVNQPPPNTAYRVYLSAPAGRTIYYYLSYVAEASAAPPGVAPRNYQLYGSEGIPILKSPVWIHAVSKAADNSWGTPWSGLFKNIGVNAPMGRRITKPTNAAVSVTYPAKPVLEPTNSLNPAWSHFTYVGNAPVTADPAETEHGAVFATANNKPGKIEWWVPSFNAYAVFESQSEVPLAQDTVLAYHTDTGAPTTLAVDTSPVANPIIHYNGLVQRKAGSQVSLSVLGIDPATDIITVIGHSLSEGSPVIFGGLAVPGGLQRNVVYFARNVSGFDFQVSTAIGGSVADITSGGSSVFVTFSSTINGGGGTPESDHLWIGQDKKLNASKIQEDFAVLELQDGNSGPFIGMQVVRLREYRSDPNPNKTTAFLGQPLYPADQTLDRRGATPWVTIGLADAQGLGGYIYQHTNPGPFFGSVFAVRDTAASDGFSKAEVVWTQMDLFGRIIWPTEIRRYAFDWEDSPQRFIVKHSGPVGPSAQLPSPVASTVSSRWPDDATKEEDTDASALRATLMDYQANDDKTDSRSTKHARIAGGQFSATDQGYALIKYGLDRDRNGQDWVGFQAVRSVFNDAVLEGGDISQAIGTEITGPAIGNEFYHEAPWPGHIHVTGANDDKADKYLPSIYGHDPTKVSTGTATERALQFNRGQIFAVNTGKLEVWWSNKRRDPKWPAGMAVYWPSKVTRYDNEWPANPNVIKIEDQHGTGELLPGMWHNWWIYFQNDPNKPGFNPNQEHAFAWPAGGGLGVFALRDDLDTAATPESYVLIPYQTTDADDALWALRVDRVTAGNFDYLGKAGTRLQPPNPLNGFTDIATSKIVSGPVWRDRKDDLWVYKDGTVVARFFYQDRPQSGFYYPSFYPKPSSGAVPWLDRRAHLRNASHALGEPIDVTYQVRWPDGDWIPGLQPAGAVDAEGRTLTSVSAVATSLTLQAGQGARFPLPTDNQSAFHVSLVDDSVTPSVIEVVKVVARTGDQLSFTRTVNQPANFPSGARVQVEHIVIEPVPELEIGESLFDAKGGLPAIRGQLSVDVLYEPVPLVKVIDPIRSYVLNSVADLPTDIRQTRYLEKTSFPDLPAHLQKRFWFEPIANRLMFTGQFFEATADDDYCYLNVLNTSDAAALQKLSKNSTFNQRLATFSAQCQHPIVLQGFPSGWGPGAKALPTPEVFESMMLTSADATGTGYVTLAMGAEVKTGHEAEPVSLEIIKVVDRLYTGDRLKVIYPLSLFDEKLTLRHPGDFGGHPENFDFIYLFRPYTSDDASQSWNDWPATGGPTAATNWEGVTPTASVWTRFPGIHGQELKIEGSSINTLTDNLVICAYRPKYGPMAGVWSQWTKPQLAEGWISRVLRGMTPFDQRYTSLRNASVNTATSMPEIIGTQPEGNTPLTDATPTDFTTGQQRPVGLLEGYSAVLDRGKDLSINGTPRIDFAPANSALMKAATKICDLYTILGNDAYADALDPSISFGTGDWQLGGIATSLHAFHGLVPDLMTEELVLLRGRDDTMLPGTRTSPWYNRLPPNLTGEVIGGEMAYALNYAIRDQAWNRIINPDSGFSTIIDDARRMYPQGHGDAWGHYLSATKTYIGLLSNPSFTWVVGTDATTVGGVPVAIDYTDERKFAAAAASKAAVGADIVNLEYRNRFSDDPDQAGAMLTDTRSDRAWGVGECGQRVGQAAYLDWVIANAILPDVDPDLSHSGIAVIDRTTVPEVGLISAAYADIEREVSNADSGVNPLGIANEAVSFDVNASLITGANAQTHFEQIYGRALEALNNAVRVFNHAYQSAQELRQQYDNVADYNRLYYERLQDFRNRLIEIFGTPYLDDIGSAGTWPTGYTGPDLVHFNYFDPSEILGTRSGQDKEVTINMLTNSMQKLGVTGLPQTMAARFNVNMEGFGLVKPKAWLRPRNSPGEIQMAISEMIQAWGRFKRSAKEYDNIIDQLSAQNRVLQATRALTSAENAAGQAKIRILNETNAQQISLDDLISKAHEKSADYANDAAQINIWGNAIAEAIPTNDITVGFAESKGDWLTSIIRSMIRTSASLNAFSKTKQATAQSQIEFETQLAKGQLQALSSVQVLAVENGVIQPRGNVSSAGVEAQIVTLLGQKAALELELANQSEAMTQASNRYLSVLSKGLRIWEDFDRAKAQAASDTQQSRYKDLAFRVFRNDAIAKYRAQFDLAARYTWMAAKAYDYETGLLPTDSKSARNVYRRIVRARSIGLVEGGQPLTGTSVGDGGLADALARMWQNWSVMKGRLGFNNPSQFQYEFSLRTELARLPAGSAGNAVWREWLQSFRVANLLDHPEFSRFCIPPQGGSITVEPGLVIPFNGAINNGLNYFSWPLGGADHAFPSTFNSIKIARAGVGFSNYDSSSTGLPATPYVYLVPAGEDKQRVAADGFTLRSWRIFDQIIPTPFPLVDNDEQLNDLNYIPSVTLGSGIFAFGQMRKFPQMRAYHDGTNGGFNANDTSVLSSRLIGRSVINTRWLLIIPGSTFSGSSPSSGLDQFINGKLVNGVRNGNGITDIKIRFDAYGYSGN